MNRTHTTNRVIESVRVHLHLQELDPFGGGTHPPVPEGKWVYVFSGSSARNLDATEREVHELQATAGGTYAFHRVTANPANGTAEHAKATPSGGDHVFAYDWSDHDELVYVLLSPERLDDARIAQYAQNAHGELPARALAITYADVAGLNGETAVVAAGGGNEERLILTESLTPRPDKRPGAFDVVLKDHWQLALQLHERYEQHLTPYLERTEGEEATKFFHAQMTKVAARAFERMKRDPDEDDPDEVARVEADLDVDMTRWNHAWEHIRPHDSGGRDGLYTYLRRAEQTEDRKDTEGLLLYGVVMADPAFQQATVDRFAPYLPATVRIRLSQLAPDDQGAFDFTTPVERWLVETGQDLPDEKWATLREMVDDLGHVCRGADHCEHGRQRMEAVFSTQPTVYQWIASSPFLVRRALMLAAEIPGSRLDEAMSRYRKAESARRAAAERRATAQSRHRRATDQVDNRGTEANAARASERQAGSEARRLERKVSEAAGDIRGMELTHTGIEGTISRLDDKVAAALLELDKQMQTVDIQLGDVLDQRAEIATARRSLLERRWNLFGGTLDALGVDLPSVDLLPGRWQNGTTRWLFSQLRDGVGVLCEALLDVSDTLQGRDPRGALVASEGTLDDLRSQLAASERRVVRKRAEILRLDAVRNLHRADERRLEKELADAQRDQSVRQDRLRELRVEHETARTKASQADQTLARARANLERAERVVDSAKRGAQSTDKISRRLALKARLSSAATAGWGRAAVVLHGVAIVLSAQAWARARDDEQRGLEVLGNVGGVLDLATGIRLVGLHGVPRTYALLHAAGAAALFAEGIYASIQVHRHISRGDDDAALGYASIAGGAAISLLGFLPAASLAGPIGIGIALIGVGIVVFCTDGPLESWLKTCYWSKDYVYTGGFLNGVDCEQSDFVCQLEQLMTLYLEPKVNVRLTTADGDPYDPRVHPSPASIEFAITPPTLFDPSSMSYDVQGLDGESVTPEVYTPRLWPVVDDHVEARLADPEAGESREGTTVETYPYQAYVSGDVIPRHLKARCRVCVQFRGGSLGALAGASGVYYDLAGEIGQWEVTSQRVTTRNPAPPPIVYVLKEGRLMRPFFS